VLIRRTLAQRFLTSVLLLLISLLGAILMVIEKREADSSFEEAKARGMLLSQNIANLNLDPLFFYDLEAIRSNIEDLVDDHLLYIVFYDRFNAPLVSSESVSRKEDVFCCSRLPADADPETVSFTRLRLEFEKKPFRVLEVERPVFARGSTTRWGSVKIGLSLEDMHDAIRRTRVVLLLIGLAGVLLGTAGAALLARRLSRPIKELAKGTVRISRGDFSHRIAVRSHDEIGELARSFNEMSRQLRETQREKEEANRKLIQAEKLASIGRIAATIAHEIRNPLTSVKLNIQRLAQRDRQDEIEREHLALSQEGIAQIEKFIKGFLNYTRVTELNLGRFAMEQIVEESLKALREAFEQKNVAVVRRYESGLPEVLGDGEKLREVFTNILRNALEAVEVDGRVELDLERVTDDAGAWIRVRIADNGCGVPAELAETIFEPFFTTKTTGVGLGLSNARKILEQHRGFIRMVAAEGGGAVVEVTLPMKEVP